VKKFKAGDTLVLDGDYNDIDRTGGLFTFICEHRPQIGHCVVINMTTCELITMCHIDIFRLATEQEC